MKGIAHKFYSLLITLCCLVHPAFAQPASDAVNKAIRSGDAAEIVRFSGSTLDITINNNQATYSRTQGELVLRDFFSRNSVRDFEIVHTGTSASTNSVYSIGTLTTASGKYRVYLLMRQRDGGYSLAELQLRLQR